MEQLAVSFTKLVGATIWHQSHRSLSSIKTFEKHLKDDYTGQYSNEIHLKKENGRLSVGEQRNPSGRKAQNKKSESKNK